MNIMYSDNDANSNDDEDAKWTEYNDEDAG